MGETFLDPSSFFFTSRSKISDFCGRKIVNLSQRSLDKPSFLRNRLEKPIMKVLVLFFPRCFVKRSLILILGASKPPFERLITAQSTESVVSSLCSELNLLELNEKFVIPERVLFPSPLPTSFPTFSLRDTLFSS